MNKTRFITDNGGGVKFVSTDPDGKDLSLTRYAVWEDRGRGKAEVFDTGDSLEYLQKKYGPDLIVIQMDPATGKSKIVKGTAMSIHTVAKKLVAAGHEDLAKEILTLSARNYSFEGHVVVNIVIDKDTFFDSLDLKKLNELNLYENSDDPYYADKKNINKQETLNNFKKELEKMAQTDVEGLFKDCTNAVDVGFGKSRWRDGVDINVSVYVDPRDMGLSVEDTEDAPDDVLLREYDQSFNGETELENAIRIGYNTLTSFNDGMEAGDWLAWKPQKKAKASLYTIASSLLNKNQPDLALDVICLGDNGHDVSPSVKHLDLIPPEEDNELDASTLVDKLEKELSRIGVDYAALGPADSIAVQDAKEKNPQYRQGLVRVYDDNADAVVDGHQLFKKISKLEDDAGYSSFWDLINEMEDHSER